MPQFTRGSTPARLIALAVAFVAVGCVGTSQRTDALVPGPVAGTTLLHYNRSHGVQVEYYAHDGHAYLWYPGNLNVVPSSYREDIESQEICFVYPRNTYNPATRHHGGEEECQSTAGFWGGVREAVDGDPFTLAARERVPFVLPRELTTMDDLQAQADR